jgi:hypothetical protein
MNLQKQKTSRASQQDMGWIAQRTNSLSPVTVEVFLFTIPFIERRPKRRARLSWSFRPTLAASPPNCLLAGACRRTARGSTAVSRMRSSEPRGTNRWPAHRSRAYRSLCWKCFCGPLVWSIPVQPTCSWLLRLGSQLLLHPFGSRIFPSRAEQTR